MKTYPATRGDWQSLPIELSDTELLIGGWQVMQLWEQPIMEVMASHIARSHGDVLEIGFGMGVSASALMRHGCRSYTVIEAHPEIVKRAKEWGGRQPTEVTVLGGFWQDIIPSMGRAFDGILFDTYPLSAAERHRNHFEFIPHAAQLLRIEGVFTCYSDETVDFRSEHLRLLLEHFAEVTLVKVDGLNPPSNCEYWQSGHMVIPVARYR